MDLQCIEKFKQTLRFIEFGVLDAHLFYPLYTEEPSQNGKARVAQKDPFALFRTVYIYSMAAHESRDIG